MLFLPFILNHLGQLTQVTDAAGIRTIGYNAYGEQETDSLQADGKTHLITETRDALGRSTGFTYAKDGAVQHTVTTGYGADGRIATAGFLHGGSEKQFSYEYFSGTNLLQQLTLPSNMTLTQEYEPNRDLLTGMLYKRSNTGIAHRSYTYDASGRPLTRTTSRNNATVTDTFGYNTRSELTSAQVNNAAYAYDYDNIGNRKTAQENAEEITSYQSNNLNQYTMLSVDDLTDFIPDYDADGNQTRVKTSTGIWAISYDAENRPTGFTKVDSSGSTTIHCEYDHMGRRATKQVTTNGSVTLRQRYIYRGYLQIACVDLTRAAHPALWFITWDPTQPVATRPLAIQKDATWYTYGWDLTKNICEVYGQHGYIRTAYTYTPYGQVTAEGDITQPIQWSSEYNDTELGLVYYNYRHYNPADGRWIGRDFVMDQLNMYIFCRNKLNAIDYRGLSTIVFAFFGADSDIESYNKLQNMAALQNKKIANIVTKADKNIDKLKQISKTCRKNMEIFHWLKCQGANILFDNLSYEGEYSDFINKIKNDTVTIKNVSLNGHETSNSIKARVDKMADRYDQSFIIGHSIIADEFTENSRFIIPNVQGEPEYVAQNYFGERHEMITCYMGDSRPRTWKYILGKFKMKISFKKESGIKCKHIKSAEISYNSFILTSYIR